MVNLRSISAAHLRGWEPPWEDSDIPDANFQGADKLIIMPFIFGCRTDVSAHNFMGDLVFFRLSG